MLVTHWDESTSRYLLKYIERIACQNSMSVICKKLRALSLELPFTFGGHNMNTYRQNCSRCGSPLRPGGSTCLRCGPSNPALRPPSLGQCSSCRAHIPSGSAFCPSCGKSNRAIGSNTSSHNNRNVVSVDNTTLIFQSLSLISSILFTIYLHSQGAD